MAKSATELATQLLEGKASGLEELRVHVFEDDESAHDDAAIKNLCAQFSTDLENAVAELSKRYGKPVRVGSSDDKAIPLTGVFRFAVWDVEGKELFVAAAHEDRGVPVLLMIGMGS